MKKARYLIGLVIISLVLLTPCIALADNYQPETEATLYTSVKDGLGNPVNNATVSLNLYASDGTKILDGVGMSYIAGSDGLYGYNFTTPAEEGAYLAQSYAAGYGYASESVSVTSTGCNISSSQIWGSNVTGYTSTTTFGGLLNNLFNNFGGDNMANSALFIILSLMALGLIVAMFVTKNSMLGFPSGIMWFILSGFCYTQHTTTWDLYYILFFGAAGIGIFAIYAAFALRKRDLAGPDADKGLFMDEDGSGAGKHHLPTPGQDRGGQPTPQKSGSWGDIDEMGMHDLKDNRAIPTREPYKRKPATTARESTRAAMNRPIRLKHSP